jgi:tubby-related protein 1
MFQCTIVRCKGGLDYFYPKYNMFISETKQFLLSAKKMSLQRTSYYLLTMNQNHLTRRSPSFLGKIRYPSPLQPFRSNFIGTEYTIYDDGENPSKTTHLDRVRS